MAPARARIEAAKIPVLAFEIEPVPAGVPGVPGAYPLAGAAPSR